MDAIEALCHRVSVARLTEPAPDAAQRDLLFRAALRAPDHGQLRPWRFLTIEGAARERLGALLASVQQQRNPDPALVDKARAMPLRAPLLVVVIARLQEHPRVPESEQLLAAGCTAHGLLLAAHALGIGAIWRTGELSHDPALWAGLGLGDGERVIGFLYLGTPQGALRTPPQLEPADFVSAWG
jgi:nitroreductase